MLADLNSSCICCVFLALYGHSFKEDSSVKKIKQDERNSNTYPNKLDMQMTLQLGKYWID